MPCDVIIAGGGPAGALAATILARAGARVDVFDRARFPRDKLCGDTLNPGAVRVLASHVPIERIAHDALPLDGMVLTGPGVAVRGTYGRGIHGWALTRRELDARLLDHAVAAGARFHDQATIAAPMIDDTTGQVVGVIIRSRDGRRREHRGRMVIAADGRESRLARAFGLTRHPLRPRRWAIGAYFEGVDGVGTSGEMHVRRGHYIGVAPLPHGRTNVCLVLPNSRGNGGWRDPSVALLAAVQADATLAPRFARARLIDGPHVLGPMAVDSSAVGVPGMLLAGDAAGFIDPITGDGLRFALAGGELAAMIAVDVLAGRLTPEAAVATLASRRHAAFGAKWRFNRTIRALVSSSAAVSAAAATAHVLPSAFRAVIRYAGDAE